VYDDISEGDTDKTRLQVYRRGDDWYYMFNIEYECNTGTLGETHIDVDIGERHILAMTTYSEGESMLVSDDEGMCIRRKYYSLCDSFKKRVRLVIQQTFG
jgi:hypothetical protein